LHVIALTNRTPGQVSQLMSKRLRIYSRRDQGRSLESRIQRALRGVGSDDLQVLALAEREQRVPRPSSGMDAAHGRSNPQAAFHEVDALVEIPTAELQVIEGTGHRWRGPRTKRDSARSQQHRSTRESPCHAPAPNDAS